MFGVVKEPWMLRASRHLSPLASRALIAARRMTSAAPLEYASSCYIPTEWLGLPLLAKREVSPDTTVYDIGLLSLSLEHQHR